MMLHRLAALVALVSVLGSNDTQAAELETTTRPAPAERVRPESAPAWATATQRRTASFLESQAVTSGVLVIAANSAVAASERAALLLSPEAAAALKKSVEAEKFGFGSGEMLSLRALGGLDQVIVLGLGDAAQEVNLNSAGQALGRSLSGVKGPVTVAAGPLTGAGLAEVAIGFGIGEYRSDLLKGGRNPADPGPVVFMGSGAKEAGAIYRTRGLALVEAIQWARDVSNLPANLMYPQAFVESTRAAFAGVPGVSLEVLDETAIRRLGMGALSGVGMGSVRPPRLLVVRYRGAGVSADRPLVFAGKGITFDSGGLSLKPSSGMINMKMDMSGAASVMGAVLALAKSGAPVNVAAVAALAENMPDGAAIRPGDVLTAMNGKTIEIISTDAEGRLVLADALVWSERNLKPAAVVDLATLTGAIRTALGDDYGGLFGRGDALMDRLMTAGEQTGERLWKLPLHPSYAADTASTIADIKNSAEGGAGAGTGAWFIGEFVSRDVPWAHIDIAGVAYGSANAVKPAGSAAFGVRLLDRFARDWGR
ncbi:M17 family metallopeptidase [Phenylobacterium sp.]|uniref:leucyl aminopeptidase family protein n=1 Tax=Phenylobacterium sp. TaxID=1871053 RepID=UPI0025E8840C|nr:leucyl aminopeptidase [Phenylobacterium sp.]